MQEIKGNILFTCFCFTIFKAIKRIYFQGFQHVLNSYFIQYSFCLFVCFKLLLQVGRDWNLLTFAGVLAQHPSNIVPVTTSQEFCRRISKEEGNLKELLKSLTIRQPLVLDQHFHICVLNEQQSQQSLYFLHCFYYFSESRGYAKKCIKNDSKVVTPAHKSQEI